MATSPLLARVLWRFEHGIQEGRLTALRQQAEDDGARRRAPLEAEHRLLPCLDGPKQRGLIHREREPGLQRPMPVALEVHLHRASSSPSDDLADEGSVDGLLHPRRRAPGIVFV